MKLTAWLLSALAPLTALSVLAQVSNSVPPVTSLPPPAASAEPVSKRAHVSKAKAKHAKAPTVKSSVVLDPPVTAIVKCEVLDVRGQGSFAGEVITHLKKGDSVTVLEEITLGHVRPNEPDQWSRIVMPTNATVWVDADFIDPETNAVRVKRVNLRGGPGENYSIVGRLNKGTAVKEISKKEGWLEIETPTNAYAFVASEYLDKQATAAPPSAPGVPVVVNVQAETPPAPAQPVETAPVAPAPTAASQADQELAASHQATAPAAPVPAPAASQPEPAKPEPPRIVTREGFVHRAYNIQAPAGYELHDIKTGELIEYLQPAPSEKKFNVFVGTRVRLTGAEFLDPSWPRTPVLHIETVDLMP
jgi:hypothetical protein